MTDEVTEDDVFVFGGGYQSFLYSIIQDLQRQGEYQSANIKTIEINTSEAMQLTITYDNSEPIQTIDFRQPIIKAEKVLIIDPDKGLPIREQLIVTLVDGSIRNLYEVNFTVFEFTNQPSEEVIKYLNQMEGI